MNLSAWVGHIFTRFRAGIQPDSAPIRALPVPKPDEVDFVAYHANPTSSCYDGSAAGWSAYKRLGDQAQYVKARYNKPLPDAAGKRGVILDYACGRFEFLKLLDTMDALLLLDHHKTSLKTLEGLPNTLLSTDRSGAILSWNYFHPDVEPPKFLLYIEDKDLWRWSLPASRAIYAGIESYSPTFEGFDRLSQISLDQLEEEGGVALRHRQRIVEELAENAMPVLFHGYRALALNSSVFESELGEELARRSGNDLGVVWSYSQETRTYRISLRSTDRGPDVSQITTRYPNGGGHRNAGGIQWHGKDINKLLVPETASTSGRVHSLLKRFGI